MYSLLRLYMYRLYRLPQLIEVTFVKLSEVIYVQTVRTSAVAGIIREVRFVEAVARAVVETRVRRFFAAASLPACGTPVPNNLLGGNVACAESILVTL